MSILTPKIQGTTNYKQFKLFQSNRQVNNIHLRRLVSSIEQKNLLYLFPIVVNKNMEVVDGQHRLAAAIQLKCPIYYLVDSNVTKADIAMVNNNRKGWVTLDFVNYYKTEGVSEYKKLHHLIFEYRIPILGAARLMRAGTETFYSGGNISNNVRSGKINADDFKIAKEICEIGRALSKHLQYSLKPYFLMDLKHILVKYEVNLTTALPKLKAKKHLFPEQIVQNSMEVRNVLKEILVKETGHSKEQVAEILGKHIK